MYVPVPFSFVSWKWGFDYGRSHHYMSQHGDPSSIHSGGFFCSQQGLQHAFCCTALPCRMTIKPDFVDESYIRNCSVLSAVIHLHFNNQMISYFDIKKRIFLSSYYTGSDQSYLICVLPSQWTFPCSQWRLQEHTRQWNHILSNSSVFLRIAQNIYQFRATFGGPGKHLLLPEPG